MLLEQLMESPQGGGGAMGWSVRERARFILVTLCAVGGAISVVRHDADQRT
jgi:hypothetical protein